MQSDNKRYGTSAPGRCAGHSKVRMLLAALVIAAVMIMAIPAIDSQYDGDVLALEDASLQATSGKCGDDLTWSIGQSNDLTITGTGAMYDYTAKDKAPWEGYSSSIETVSLPSGLTKIGSYAFYKFIELSGITIPKSVTQIGEGAFEECKYMGEVVFENANIDIGKRAFYKCTWLTATIDQDPSSHIKIGEGAFYLCEYMKEFLIPGKATIGTNGFGACYKLTTVTFPDDVSIGQYGFSGVPLSSELVFHGYADMVGGAVSGSKVSNVVFEKGANIGATSFWGCTDLTSVKIIGDAYIGATAFFGDTALKSFECTGNITFGSAVFMGCSGYPELVLSSKVTTEEGAFYGSLFESVTINGDCILAKGAFNECETLKTFTCTGNMTVGEGAFNKCTGLESVTINGEVELSQGSFNESTAMKSFSSTGKATVHQGAFYGCSVETVTLNDCILEQGAFYENITFKTFVSTGKTVADEGAFYGCSVETATLNDCVLGKGAFNECTALKTFVSNGYANIGEGAFNGCTALTTVEFKGEFILNKGAFNGCTALTAFSAEGKAELMEGVFNECTSLASIEFKGDCTLNRGALNECTALTTFVSDGYAKFGEGAFNGCTALMTVEFKGECAFDGGVFNGCTALKTLYIPKCQLGEGTFVGSSLESVVIDNCNYIPKGAFAYIGTLKSVTLNSAKELGDGVFIQCTSLTDVVLPNATVYGMAVFQKCSSLTSYTFMCDVENTGLITFDSSSVETIEFKGKANIMAYLCGMPGYAAPLKNVIFNDETIINAFAFTYCEVLEHVDFSKVVSIGTAAFQGCYSLKDVYIGDNVRYMESDVFTDCTALETVTMPISLCLDSFYLCYGIKTVTLTGGDGTSWDYEEKFRYLPWNYSTGCVVTLESDVGAIGNYMFAGWDGMVTLESDNIKRIGAHAFDGCTKLSKVVLPDDAVLGEAAFKGCTSLTSMNVPAKMTYIPASLFEGCTNLSAVTASSSVNAIDDRAFKDCAISSFPINKRIETIGEEAFDGCALNIDTLNLTSNRMTIGAHAFRGNTNLTTLVISDSVEYIGAGCFDGCTRLQSITVPISMNLVPETGMPFTDSLGSLRYIEFTTGTGEGVDYDKEDILKLWSTLSGEPVTVKISDVVEYIGANSFNGFKGMKEIVLPDFTATVGSEAFAGCTDLEKVTLGYLLTDVDENAFAGCDSIKTVVNKIYMHNLKPGSQEYGKVALHADNVIQGSELVTSGDAMLNMAVANAYTGDCLIISNLGDATGDYVMPESFTMLDGTVITNIKIGKEVYKDSDFDSVTIGANCTAIGRDAFYRCIDRLGGEIRIDAPGAVIAPGAFGEVYPDRIVFSKHIQIAEEAFDCDFLIDGDLASLEEIPGKTWVNDPDSETGWSMVPEGFGSGGTTHDINEKVAIAAAIVIAAMVFIFHLHRR